MRFLLETLPKCVKKRSTLILCKFSFLFGNFIVFQKQILNLPVTIRRKMSVEDFFEF